LPAWNFQIAAAWGAGADENGIKAFIQKALQAIDPGTETAVNAKVENVADFLVDNLLGQAEFGDLAADHTAALPGLVDDGDLVAKRRKIAGDG
jgi:hypothetical protein